MNTICFHEFKSLFKSFKTLAIIGIIFGSSYLLADVMGQFMQELGTEEIGKNGYAAGLMILIVFFGLFFVSGLSHDTINREVSSRTMRFLVTKTSRTKIIIGKFLGISLFWTLCLFISFLLISSFSKEFLWLSFAESIIFITFSISLIVLVSVAFPRPAVTMFFGIILALLFPAISFWAIATSNPLVSWFKFLSPYYYIYLGGSYITVPVVMTVLLLVISIFLFKRSDL
jgi:ABC-2 type transport system permease protein